MHGPILAYGRKKLYYKDSNFGWSKTDMAVSQLRLKSNKKYLNEKLEEIKFRVPIGNKARIQEHAKAQGESTNAFIYRAVNEAIERDKQK